MRERVCVSRDFLEWCQSHDLKLPSVDDHGDGTATLVEHVIPAAAFGWLECNPEPEAEPHAGAD